jgi:hypothetical protein
MGSLDPGYPGPNIELSNNNFDVNFTGDSAVKSEFYAFDVAFASDLYTVFEVNVAQDSLAVGVTNAFYDQDISYGGEPPNIVSYNFDGYIKVNETIVPGFETFQIGDVIGVVIRVMAGGYGDSYISFFKNGILQYTTAQVTSFAPAYALITQVQPIPPISTGSIAVTNPDYYFLPNVFSWMSTNVPGVTYQIEYPYADITPVGGTVTDETFFVKYDLPASGSFRLGPQLEMTPGTYYVIEYEILSLPNSGNGYYLGWWSSGFGPPYDSGSPSPTVTAPWIVYESTSEIVFYGSSGN